MCRPAHSAANGLDWGLSFRDRGAERGPTTSLNSHLGASSGSTRRQGRATHARRLGRGRDFKYRLRAHARAPPQDAPRPRAPRASPGSRRPGHAAPAMTNKFCGFLPDARSGHLAHPGRPGRSGHPGLQVVMLPND